MAREKAKYLGFWVKFCPNCGVDMEISAISSRIVTVETAVDFYKRHLNEKAPTTTDVIQKRKRIGTKIVTVVRKMKGKKAKQKVSRKPILKKYDVEEHYCGLCGIKITEEMRERLNPPEEPEETEESKDSKKEKEEQE